MNNIEAFNNTNGIHIAYRAGYNVLNNIHTFNNSYGLWINDNAYRNTINNIQTNNNGYGIYLENYANPRYENTINNAQIYNNVYGLTTATAGSNNNISNTQIYNNSQYGILGLTLGATITYYGDNAIYANGTNIDDPSTYFITGTNLSRSDGTYTTT